MSSNINRNQVRLAEIAKHHYDWVEYMGWHNKSVLEYLAFISSEIGEAVDECRGEEPTEDLRYELADIVLRTADLAEVLNIDLGQACLDKIDKNMVRGTKGRKY